MPIDPVSLRIAMWSGPRNISTALMRAWGNRPDTFVCDEPFYAHYLLTTGKPHPIAEEIIAHDENDWRKVVAWLTGELPDPPSPLSSLPASRGIQPLGSPGVRVFYQKHMSHHLLPHIDRGWLAKVTNSFLIRHPQEVITSYIKISPEPTLEDLGFVQLTEIFEWVTDHTGYVPPVLDAKDVLQNPRRMLGLLCDALGVEFTDEMLSWPPGLRETDGIWAEHWYREVKTSTGFRPHRPKPDPVPAHLSAIYQQCLVHYHRLYEHRLR